MDKILQYQKLSDIKPLYQRLTLPFHNPSKFKLKHNIDELELYYKEFGIWQDSENTKKTIKSNKSTKSTKSFKGGEEDDISLEKKAMFILNYNLGYDSAEDI